MTASPQNTASIDASPSMGLGQTFAYAAPAIAVAFLYGPVHLVQGIYAKYFGLALSTIAGIVLVARLFDAITDPLIGYLSDRYYQRVGGRKPFVVLGCLLLVVSSYFLYVPFDTDTVGTSTNVSATYFLIWFLAFYFAWTLFEIPHLAWASELAPHSMAKNKVYCIRVLAVFIGHLAFYAVPLLPVFATNEFTPKTLEWSVVIAGVLMLPLLYFCTKSVPNNGVECSGATCQPCNKGVEKEGVAVLLPIILGNKPFLLFLMAFLFAGVGVGMWFALVFIYVDVYLKQGDQLALIYLLSLSVSMVTLAAWYKLAVVFGKKLAWGLGVILTALGIAGTGLLNPGETNFSTLAVVMILIYTGFASITMLAPSLLADINDYGTWKFGVDRTATYFSLYTLITKANVALGGALGLAIAGWYGFDAAAQNHSEENIRGLHLAIAYLPALITLIAVVFIALISINTPRHAIIQHRLNSRAKRQARSENSNKYVKESLLDSG